MEAAENEHKKNRVGHLKAVESEQIENHAERLKAFESESTKGRLEAVENKHVRKISCVAP